MIKFHKQEKSVDKSVKKYLAVAGFVIAAAFFAISEYEKKSLTIKRYIVKSKKTLNKDRTLVFLSDLHDHEFGSNNSNLISAIKSVKPDVVLIGGDMMVCKKKVDIIKTLNLCKQLISLYPVYYGNGNHETRMNRNRKKYGDIYDNFHKALSDMGVIHLEDASVIFDKDIMITGIDIEEPYYKNFKCKDMKQDYITKKVSIQDLDKFQILLAHSPMFLKAYKDWGADLSLAGHFHGGTIRLPKNIGLMTPQYQFFNKNVTGMHKDGDSVLVISPGLGTHSINIRINNKPQVVVVEIKK